MSLKDFDVESDNFEFDRERAEGYCFPCCFCRFCNIKDTDYPCYECGHTKQPCRI